MSVFVNILSRDKTKPGFTSASNNAKGLEKSIQKTTKSIKFLSVALVGIGIKAVTSFASFDNKVREISTLMDDMTKGEMKNLGNEIKQTAVTFGQSLDSMAKARYDIISAGFNNAANSAIVMQQSAKLAVAGVAQVAQTADVLTTALNAYGKTAESAAHVSDVLFTTVRLGKTTIPELAQNFGTLTAIAPTVGVKIEELAAGMATLTAAGQSTSIATTAIQATMSTLLAPSEALTKRLSDMGFASGAAAVKSLGLQGALKEITKGTTEAEKAALFPNVRAMKAVFPLVGTQADKFAKNLEEMGNVSGATDTAVGKMSEGIQFKINQIKTQFKILLVDWGEKLVLAGGAFLKLGDGVKTAIVAVLGFAAAIRFLGGPIAWIITAAGFIWRAYSKNFGGLKDMVDEAGAYFKKLADQTINTFKTAGAIIGALLSGNAEAIPSFTKKWTEENLRIHKQYWADLKDIWDKKRKESTFSETFNLFSGGAFKMPELPDLSGQGQGDQSDKELQHLSDVEAQKQAIRDASNQTYKDSLDELGAYEMEILDKVNIRWQDKLTERLDMVNEFTNLLADVASQYEQFEEARIKKDQDLKNRAARKKYETDKAYVEKTMSVEGVLTRKGKTKLEQIERDYRDATTKISENAERKERELSRRMYWIKVGQAITNTAVGVTKELQKGGVWGIITGALVAAAGAIQIATIKAQNYASGTLFATSGSDTIPAMLTPGEAVIPAPVVRNNAPLVQQLVSGQTDSPVQKGDEINVVFNVSAIDSRGIADLVESEDFKQSFADLINNRTIRIKSIGSNNAEVSL